MGMLVRDLPLAALFMMRETQGHDPAGGQAVAGPSGSPAALAITGGKP